MTQHAKAYDRHVANSSLLQGTDENENPHEPFRELLSGIAIQPHAREVAERIDKRIYDEIHSPLLADNAHDIFSPQLRPKLRTLSSSNSRSALSVFSSDASDGVCVSERAALFESGEVGRHANKTAEEREGRVLEHNSRKDGFSTSLPISSPDSQSEEDVFGMTIRPSMVTRLSEPLRDTGIAIDAKSMVTVPLAIPSDTPKIGTTDAVAETNVLAEDQGDTSRFDPTQSSLDETSPGDLASAAVKSNIRNVSALGSSSTLDASPIPAISTEIQQSSHMAHMIAHEQAGRKPYGALRRAHSTPVPRLSEHQKFVLAGKECIPSPGLGASNAMLALDHASPRQNLCARVFSLAVAPSPDSRDHREKRASSLQEEKDASRVVSFKLPKMSDSVTTAEKSIPSSSTGETQALKEMTDRLAVAESRITELEQLLARFTEGKTLWEKQLASKQDESSKSSAKNQDCPTDRGDSTSMTGPWRWFAVPELISPFASRFGPPQTLGQLPGYVFLVGVGLSVIVARVVFSHSLSRGK